MTAFSEQELRLAYDAYQARKKNIKDWIRQELEARASAELDAARRDISEKMHAAHAAGMPKTAIRRATRQYSNGPAFNALWNAKFDPVAAEGQFDSLDKNPTPPPVPKNPVVDFMDGDSGWIRLAKNMVGETVGKNVVQDPGDGPGWPEEGLLYELVCPNGRWVIDPVGVEEDGGRAFPNMADPATFYFMKNKTAFLELARRAAENLKLEA